MCYTILSKILYSIEFETLLKYEYIVKNNNKSQKYIKLIICNTI